jgi:lysyl-tRNA synthetase, class II
LIARIKESIPTIIGRTAYLLGLLDILANVLRPFKAPAKKLNTYVPILINSTAFAAAVFTGIALIIVARGLIRRKTRARNFTIGILLINIASDFFRIHRHLPQIIVSVTFLIVLIIFRKEFYAISDPTTKFAPIQALVIGVLVVIISGVIMLYFRHGNDLVGNPSFKNILLTVVEGMVGISGPVEFTSERISNTVDVALATMGLLTLIIPLWLFFRRIAPLPKMSEDEMSRVLDLINYYQDQDSLGYFATRADKSVIWSNNNMKAGIAYRVQGGVMLASGDPFGEYSLWGEAIENFLEVARQHAWTPAVMGASDVGGEVWVERADMLAIDIGDEAVIKVEDFTLEGRPMANVRQMVNRIKRKGYSTRTARLSELSGAEITKLRKLAKEWRYGVSERGFSMSMDRFAESKDSNCLVTIAELEGQIKGFLYFVPWGENRVSLDRMQRERGTDPGLNELIIAETVEYSRTKGITHISLNFAAFRSLFERADKISAGPITRGARNLIRFFSNWFQVESLYRFNAKFQPEWQTRYVLYPKARDLPKVGWAALRAEKFISGFRSHSV